MALGVKVHLIQKSPDISEFHVSIENMYPLPLLADQPWLRELIDLLALFEKGFITLSSL